MKKIFLNSIIILTSILSVAQTEYKNTKPLTESEIKNSYIFKNNEDKYKSSELIKSIPVTDYDLTKDFLIEIEKVLESTKSLKNHVKDTLELETLNKSIYQLNNIQNNMTSTSNILYYKAIMKYTNYSNKVTIDTINVEPIIDYYGKVGGYEKNRLKWLRKARENVTELNQLHAREKFEKICYDLKPIQEKESYRLLKISEEEKQKIENQIYSVEELDKLPEFPGGIDKFYNNIKLKFQYPDVQEEIKGKLVVEFTIYKDGSTGNFNIIEDVGFGCSEELIRVIKILPRWIPAQKNGKSVNTRFKTDLKLNKQAE
ncbi:TonB-like protein [Flavobacterium croceum DSM 17960]|uniref:TonB-like protein n=1 Tax=Flavobacterium croceum DSM 17960 TaxID=1121886 RepID=A0A2S4N497_9FLAO|nr:TonB-like protein [Flavobacterium croceum DSM 17960]